jgi:hypothetical protein
MFLALLVTPKRHYHAVGHVKLDERPYAPHPTCLKHAYIRIPFPIVDLLLNS